MMIEYNQTPINVIKGVNREIAVFQTEGNATSNIDASVVASFGEEWTKFQSFNQADVTQIGELYFDILNDEIINKNTKAIDIGCGTGRWTKYLLDKIGFVEAVDPSNAIFSADRLLGDALNVRLSKASTDNLPFADESFDFGMSIGVLHHIPNTQKALTDCVKKIKVGGYFYIYLYYALDSRSLLFRFLFQLSSILRKIISSLPSSMKKILCDIIAITVYLPFVWLGKLFKSVGLKKFAARLPLKFYQDKSFFIIRNDALDRFGTSLEQRFTREQVLRMMQTAGLQEIEVSDGEPYWHAVGKRYS
jgi:ubiquinone/menaquinone biosynthesis C-methylase UbiE